MSSIDDLSQLIASGRIIFDSGNAEALRRELLGLPPTRAIEPKLQALVAGLCKRVPNTTFRVSSLYRNGDSHHAEGRAIDFGNEDIATSVLPVIAKQTVVDELSIDEIIFDATVAGETIANKYNFDNGKPHVFDTATLAQHRDHIHFSVRP